MDSWRKSMTQCVLWYSNSRWNSKGKLMWESHTMDENETTWEKNQKNTKALWTSWGSSIHCPTLLISSISKTFPIAFSSIFKVSPNPWNTFYTSWQLRVHDQYRRWTSDEIHFHHIQSTIIPFKGSILKQCTISLLKQYAIRILSVL